MKLSFVGWRMKGLLVTEFALKDSDGNETGEILRPAQNEAHLLRAAMNYKGRMTPQYVRSN